MEGLWSLGVFLIPIAAIIGGITAGIVATVTRGRIRELEIRERIAMIERGVVPPPESDPETFDRRMHSMDQLQRRRERVAPRHRSAGVILIAVGLGLAVLMTYAADVPRQGLGVGGFIVILGLGFLVNSLFTETTPAGVRPPAFPRQNDPPFPPAPGS
jgi:hypothetical protein